MLSQLRKLLAKPEPAFLPENLELFPPQLHQFGQIAEWLSAWVTFQITVKKRNHVPHLPSGTGLNLVGSIGLNSAITPDGTVWIELIEDMSSEYRPSWRLADSNERSCILISAQRRLYPELIILLSQKPSDAVECPECSGTGFMHQSMVWCSTCGCRGWITANGA